MISLLPLCFHLPCHLCDATTCILSIYYSLKNYSYFNINCLSVYKMDKHVFWNFCSEKLICGRSWSGWEDIFLLLAPPYLYFLFLFFWEIDSVSRVELIIFELWFSIQFAYHDFLVNIFCRLCIVTNSIPDWRMPSWNLIRQRIAL